MAAIAPNDKHPVFQAAEAFRQGWVDLGHAASELDISINRYGQASAYFAVTGHGVFRVSDHSTNSFYRPDERTVHYTSATAAEAAAYKRQDDEFWAKTRPEREAREAAEKAEADKRTAELQAEQALAAKRREFWDAQLVALNYKGSRQNAIKKLKKEGVKCPF